MKVLLFLCVLAFPASVFAQDVDPVVLRAQAANGSVSAAAALGAYYQDVQKDLKRAEKWFYAAANAGDAEAQYRLAKIYDASREGRHPNKEVVSWLEKSGGQGHMEAQLMLGKIYQFGRRGIPKDLSRARIWYDMAAAKGSKEAMLQIENLYGNVQDGYVKAVYNDEDLSWLDASAKQGNPEAAARLAVLAERGYGIPQDYKRAAALYEVAAKAGIPQAETSLGGLYAAGLGVPQDYEKAVFWLSNAAEAGFVEAQRKLADIYAYKRGDSSKAYAWTVISLSAMFPNAQDLVQVSPDLERLLRSMTESEIRAGQTLALQLVERIKENKKQREERQKEQLERMEHYRKAAKE